MNDVVQNRPLVDVKNLHMQFELTHRGPGSLGLRRRKNYVHAVNDVSFSIEQGEAFCLVGESGCGKSTIARLITGLERPTSGEIHFDGQRVDQLSRGEQRPLRKRMQMIFQNPYASLNPRMTVDEALVEPLKHHFPDYSPQDIQQRKTDIMRSVGIDQTWSDRYPDAFSGGQRQRIAIARALTVDPEFMIADEPISALDASIQAQILNLMLEARAERGITYLFIAHDLNVVQHFATRVAVLYLGSICEISSTRTLFERPKHPYTRALLSAIPQLKDDKPKYIRLRGERPTPLAPPTGCPFESRCHFATNRCRHERPRPMRQPDGSTVACHAVEEDRLDD
jgi:peptide/nickel transport system ATP-binding protein